MQIMKESEYQRRRECVSCSLKKNSLAIIFSARAQIRSNDTEFPYRQDSNFYYLTGFKEDNAILILRRGKRTTESYLFVQKKVKELELWTGKRVGVKAAKNSFKHDNIFISDRFEEKFLSFMKEHQYIYYDFTFEDKQVDFIREKTKHLSAHFNIATLIAKERLVKSPAEIKLIKKALEITKEAHHYAKDYASELSKESELQAGIEYIFKKNGAYSDAYTSIVACANAANTLHYISNEKKLLKGALILIDAGCEYEYYASDITRTIPVSGRFSKAQKELYSLVLSVNKEIIKMIRPGVLRSELQNRSEELLCRGMIKLGILHGNVSELLEAKAHKKYYPHGIGHWMGLDVHDECPYKDEKGKEIPLQAGMVLTIEPGLYLDEGDKSVPKKYRGTGIRIEDNILVTKEGYENLSFDIAKEIEEIES